MAKPRMQQPFEKIFFAHDGFDDLSQTDFLTERDHIMIARQRPIQKKCALSAFSSRHHIFRLNYR
jgi:hypothetical protein